MRIADASVGLTPTLMVQTLSNTYSQGAYAFRPCESTAPLPSLQLRGRGADEEDIVLKYELTFYEIYSSTKPPVTKTGKEWYDARPNVGELVYIENLNGKVDRIITNFNDGMVSTTIHLS